MKTLQLFTNPVTGSMVIGEADGPPLVKLKKGQEDLAKLIAAAPEMLEALEYYADPDNWKMDTDGNIPASNDSGYAARAIIASLQ